MAKTAPYQGKNGQWKVTVPKGVAEAMQIEGKKFDWRVKSGSSLEVKIVDE